MAEHFHSWFLGTFQTGRWADFCQFQTVGNHQTALPPSSSFCVSETVHRTRDFKKQFSTPARDPKQCGDRISMYIGDTNINSYGYSRSRHFFNCSRNFFCHKEQHYVYRPGFHLVHKIYSQGPVRLLEDFIRISARSSVKDLYKIFSQGYTGSSHKNLHRIQDHARTCSRISSGSLLPRSCARRCKDL